MISEVSFHINRFRVIFCNLPMITFSLALSADFLSLQKAPTLPPPIYSKTLLNHAQEKLLKKTPRASTQQKKALKRSNSRQKPSKAFQNLFQLSLKSLTSSGLMVARVSSHSLSTRPIRPILRPPHSITWKT